VCNMVVPGWVRKCPGARARVILWAVFTQKHPKTTRSYIPLSGPQLGPTLAPRSLTHTASITALVWGMMNVFLGIYVCVVVWRGRGRRGEVVKTHPMGEQGHWVGKRRNTTPPSRGWQDGNIRRTSGAGRGVGSVLRACRRPGVHVWVRTTSENSPYEPVWFFQNERKTNQTNYTQPRIGC